MGTMLFIVVFALICMVMAYLIFGPILKKAGFPKWYAIAMIIPFINVIATWWFAFAKWPAQAQAKQD